MPRIRSIKPDFFLDDVLAECSHISRLVFAGLWCLADREGRLVDNPKKIKAQLLPYEQADMDAILNDLSRKPFIQRYEVDESRYIQIVNFTEHQRPHHTEPASTIPAFNGCLTVVSPLLDGKHPAGREGKGREGKGIQASPTSLPVNNFSTEMVEKAKKALDLGFNVYQQIAIHNKGRINKIPETLVNEILDEFLCKRETIEDIFPYMARVTQEKSRRYWKGINDSECLKNKKDIGSAGDVLRKLAGASA